MIIDGREHGMWWGPTTKGARTRAEPLRGCCWHWTGGEGDARAVHRVLSQRGLSIHYVIDGDGVVWQMADPATTVAAHAGPRANAAFIGVEIVSRGIAPSLPRRPREVVQARVKGRAIRALALTEAQRGAVADLALHMRDAYGIPLVVPPHLDAMIPAEIRRWRGHIEHLHVPGTTKVDVGGLAVSVIRSIPESATCSL